MKLEVVVIPVSDVDRAKEFYAGLGWRLDADFPVEHGFRVVQFTPPGSACSVQFGSNMTSAAPGSAAGPVPDRVRHRGCARATSRRTASRSARCSTTGAGARSSPTARRARPRARRPTAPATAPSPPSATPTATAGCCRRSRAAARPGRRRRTAFASTADLAEALRRAAARTASTRSAPARRTRTGRTGTPRHGGRAGRRGTAGMSERVFERAMSTAGLLSWCHEQVGRRGAAAR